jgi:hypothetical protein
VVVALDVLPALEVTVAVMVFCPVASGTEALQASPDTLAPTPFTVTLLTPEPALAVAVTVSGELVSVAPAAGVESVTAAGCSASRSHSGRSLTAGC